MAKLVSVTSRISSDIIEYVDKTSKMFDIDRSTAFRSLLKKGIQEDRKEKALDLYIKGKFSVEQASKFAGVYIEEFYELMKEKGVENNLTMDDFKDSLKHMKRL